MARYKVVVSRVEYLQTDIEVETDDEEEVKQLAIKEASDFEVIDAKEFASKITRLPDATDEDIP